MPTDTKRIAAFGFRSIPPTAGCAGADKFAEELFTRLVERGFEVNAYNRVYEETPPAPRNYKGINIISFRTVKRKGFFKRRSRSGRAPADNGKVRVFG